MWPPNSRLFFSTGDVAVGSAREADRDQVPDGRAIVAVRANVRGVRGQCRGPRAAGPVARPPAGHHAALSAKQLQHHVHVGTRSISAQDHPEPGLVHRHERQHPQETREFHRLDRHHNGLSGVPMVMNAADLQPMKRNRDPESEGEQPGW